MKSGVTKKSIKPGNKALALFSRLRGLGIAGFASHQLAQKEENTAQEKDELSDGNNKTRVVKFCQHQQHCQNQVNCQPVKNDPGYASVDLWFYLSPQS